MDVRQIITGRINSSVQEAVRAIQFLQEASSQAILLSMAEAIAEAFSNGNKIIIAGNGGSLCDAMHVAEELTGYFRKKRPALPAIALSDPSHITCVGNDTSFSDIFARSIEALGVRGDIFLAMTTSGNSENIRRGIAAAREKGLKVLSFLGKDGGAARGLADQELLIPGFPYSDRVQEAHMAALHIIVEAVELLMFPALREG